MSDILARLQGYNPPDRTEDSQRQISADIHDAAVEIAALRAQLAERERQLKEAREALTKLRTYFNGRVQLHASMDYPQGTDKISQQYRELWTDICEISSIILGFELGILTAPVAERKE